MVFGGAEETQPAPEQELTERQVREREAWEAEKKAEKIVRRPMSTRDFLRKQVGWPALRKN